MAQAMGPVLLSVMALSVAGCASVVAGSAVKAPGAASVESTRCTAVSSPMASIEAHTPGEPTLRIPQPAGWQRSRQLDSQLIRYAQVNRDLVENSFAPTATVTLESAPGTSADEAAALDRERQALIAMLGATDLSTTFTTLCGYRAETLTYTAPPIGRIPARKAMTLGVVATLHGTMYVATVTVQTTDPREPTYANDSKTILTGFQMLPPDAK